MKTIFTTLILASLFGLSACTPEVGSDKWCEMIKEKSSGDITANEAADYATNCVFK